LLLPVLWVDAAVFVPIAALLAIVLINVIQRRDFQLTPPGSKYLDRCLSRYKSR
jgi:hypothetical protein